MLRFLSVRTLLMVIAHDPSAIYFLGLLKIEKQHLKHTLWGRPLVKFPKHPPHPLHAPHPELHNPHIGNLAIYQIHTHLILSHTDFQEKNHAGK